MALDALVEMEANDLRGFLGDEKLRSSVGRALVRLGSRDGVAALLDTAEQGDFWVLFSLNALCNPEVWAKLRKQGLRRDLRGKPKEVTEAWSKEAGFALEEIRGDERQMVRSDRGRTTLWEALWEISNQDTNCLVLESDRIRNLSPKEALTLWKAWWELERKK